MLISIGKKTTNAATTTFGRTREAPWVEGTVMPVIWTRVAYMETGADCGVWGMREDGPDALREWLDRETETYTRLIRANNIRLD